MSYKTQKPYKNFPINLTENNTSVAKITISKKKKITKNLEKTHIIGKKLISLICKDFIFINKATIIQ